MGLLLNSTFEAAQFKRAGTANLHLLAALR